MSVRQKAKR
ncbi:uncharacterized protein FFM5_15330 [Fusarium fujikuroi]|nr:uncharacterized protein FFM5_15330 [Fusarium fujikuroi]